MARLTIICGNGIEYDRYSYALKNIACNQLNIIEYPEFRLPPLFQAKLAVDYCFQLKQQNAKDLFVITNSEHLISKLRYCVFTNMIDSDQVDIHFIDELGESAKIEYIQILSNGIFCNESGEKTFPRGFFDATLDDIYEINGGKK